MKPKTPVVMPNIIKEVRDNLPFDMSEDELCAETCSHGCPKNFLEFSDSELEDWDQRLQDGKNPNFHDIQKLNKTSQKIYKVLEKNHLVKK